LIELGEVATQRAAAHRVGCSETHLSEVLHSAEGRAFCARIRGANIERAGLRASHRLQELVDARSEHVASETALKVLGLLGHVPVQEHRHHVEQFSVGYVVDLRGSEDRGEALDVTPSPSAPVFVSSPAGEALDAAASARPTKAEPLSRRVLEHQPSQPTEPASVPNERTIDETELASLQHRLALDRSRRLRGRADDDDPEG
jgi:hypothetical protein